MYSVLVQIVFLIKNFNVCKQMENFNEKVPKTEKY